MLAGDPLLELQSNAISTLANTQIPGTDSWAKVASWLRDFVQACEADFDYCFIDMNPSFSCTRKLRWQFAMNSSFP